MNQLVSPPIFRKVLLPKLLRRVFVGLAPARLCVALTQNDHQLTPKSRSIQHNFEQLVINLQTMSQEKTDAEQRGATEFVDGPGHELPIPI
jgi:hypothetical protein